MIFRIFVWRCGLVVETWLRDEEVPGSSPGCARSILSPWERLFTCISSPHSCVKRVPCYRQLLCTALQGVEKGSVVGMACQGPHVKMLRALFVDKRYINAPFKFFFFLYCKVGSTRILLI